VQQFTARLDVLQQLQRLWEQGSVALVTGVTADEAQPCAYQSEVGEPENDGTIVQHEPENDTRQSSMTMVMLELKVHLLKTLRLTVLIQSACRMKPS